MATWKRLTSSDGVEFDVNMEQVAYIRRYGEHTNLYFVGGIVVSVKETPDRIPR
jgi:hypothetical protein